MTWEKQLLDLFDDLESQAEGLAMVERDAERGELRRAQYAEVDLESRLHGSVGAEISLTLDGPGVLRGRLGRVGRGWFLVRTLHGADQEWLVSAAAVSTIQGLGERTIPSEARPISTRLGLASVLRGLAERQDQVQVLCRQGVRLRGVLHRAGADFVEIVGEDGRAQVVALDAVAAVSSNPAGASGSLRTSSG